MAIVLNPAEISFSIWWSISGFPFTSNKGLGFLLVNSPSLLPKPAANIIAFIIIFLLFLLRLFLMQKELDVFFLGIYLNLIFCLKVYLL